MKVLVRIQMKRMDWSAWARDAPPHLTAVRSSHHNSTIPQLATPTCRTMHYFTPPPLCPKHNICAMLAPECLSPFPQQVLTCGLHEGSGRFGVHPVARIRDGGVATARE